jgi:hypothetical protein
MAQTGVGFGQIEGGPIGKLGRDLRIDLIRGLSLWMIFADHIPGDLLGHITYRHFALSDALDIFVLLSGLSCCLLYGKIIRAAGLVRAQMRALHRVGQLYGGYFCVGLVTIACYFGFHTVLDPSYIAGNDLALLGREPLHAVSAMLWLFYTPQFMDILPLYIILVAAAPTLVFLLMRSEATALGLSAGIWLSAALMPELNVPSLDAAGVVSLNPLSWQLLFCLGLWIGKRYFIDDIPFQPVPWLRTLCWLVVIAGATTRHATWFGVPDLIAFERAHNGTNEQIVPLANLLAGAYLTACHLPASAAWLRSKWLSPLLICGRHSLEVFCAGVALSMLGTVFFRLYGTGFALQIVVNGTSFVVMTAIAVLRERKRARSLPSLDILGMAGTAQDEGSRL